MSELTNGPDFEEEEFEYSEEKATAIAQHFTDHPEELECDESQLEEE